MAFDPNDEDAKKAIKEAVDAAVEAAKGPVDDKNKELLDELKKTKAELRKVKDVNPEDHAALEAANEKLTTDLAAANKTIKDTTTAKEKAEKALEQESGFTQKLLIQDGIKSALLANGVKDEDMLDVLTAKFASGAKVIVEGEDRKALYGDKPLGDFFKEWAGSDAGKKFVQAPINGGGGAPGGKTGGNAKTVTRDAFNGMEPAAQMAFSKEGGKVVDAAA
jgi:hypothetical protein